jgi:hypothetical protein
VNSRAIPGYGVLMMFAATGRPAACGADVLASACGARKTAAARPAPTIAGAAATGRRRAVRGRDGLLWQPKGLLSERFALTGKAA